jgi:excisionase family DNA binding protein
MIESQVTRNRLLTPPEAASFLCISMPTLWRRVKDGTIHAIHLGPRVVRFRPEELESLMVDSSKVGS